MGKSNIMNTMRDNINDKVLKEQTEVAKNKLLDDINKLNVEEQIDTAAE